MDGKLRKAYIFNMRLSYSRLDYYEVVFDQKVNTWIQCHINAFKYFGGVPRIIKLDNLKAAIILANYYEPIYQEQYKRLKEFKLSGMARALDTRLIYARSKKLPYEEFLELLCEDERDNRRDNNYKRRYSLAKLPQQKKLEDFDFSFQTSIDEREVNDIAGCRFIAARDNVILIGDSGTGKTHLAISFALKALSKEYKVFFTTVSDMLYNLHISRADNS